MRLGGFHTSLALSLLSGICCVAITMSLVAAPQSEIDALAARIADTLARKKLTSVAVMSFVGAKDQESALGKYLAAELSTKLKGAAPQVKVIPAATSEDFRNREKLSAGQLNTPAIACWVAERFGAAVVVVGRATVAPGGIELSVEVHEARNGKPLAREKRKLPKVPDLEPLLVRDAETLRLVRQPPSQPPKQGAADIHLPGQDGASPPTCVYCPTPMLSSRAVRAGWSGIVILDVVIESDGRPSNVSVIRGAPFDLNDQAVAAVRTWLFEPARKDGQAVRTRVAVEVSFRLFR